MLSYMGWSLYEFPCCDTALRSPNASYGNNVRNVNLDGSVSNNNANNSNGVAPDWVEK